MTSFFIIVALLLWLICSNILVFKIIKRRAIKYYIKPYFDDENLEIIDTEFTGIFNNGDFGRPEFVFRPVPKMGNIVSDMYIYVYIQKVNNIVRYTAKIRTVFWFIKKVELKGSGTTIQLIRKS